MGYIRYEVADRVATITIDRPEKRNAMSYAVLGEFTEAVWRASDDDDARVVIITGAGGSFCAGTDLSDLQDTPPSERFTTSKMDDPRQARHPWFIVGCPKPVIAAVDGAAAGMGVEFATQCDVRIASDRAKFGWVFVKRGLVPDMGAASFLLPRIVGHSNALRLMLSGEFIDADEAAAIGFVSAVVKPDDLLDAARCEAERYLGSSPFAVARTKALAYDAIGAELTDHMARNRKALEECFASEDHKEGLQSFLERRPANFTGR